MDSVSVLETQAAQAAAACGGSTRTARWRRFLTTLFEAALTRRAPHYAMPAVRSCAACAFILGRAAMVAAPFVRLAATPAAFTLQTAV
eukprot:6181951-Pleurochrysis_carterae.AAC.1